MARRQPCPDEGGGGLRQDAPDSFKTVWNALLDRAVAISDHALSLIDHALPENTSMATLPHGIVYRLHLAATATYRSAIVCLRSPETSVSAFALLRGLLEAWAHLDFIGDDGQGGDVRCRALRYELGAAKEWMDSVHDAPPGFDQETWGAQAQTRLVDIQEAWQLLGCTGKPRTRKEVDATLHRMGKRAKMEWVPGAWRATSVTVHMYGVDFALLDRGDGSSDLVWALPRYQATWLSLAASSYAYLTLTAARTLGAANATQFGEEVRLLVEGQELRRVLDVR